LTEVVLRAVFPPRATSDDAKELSPIFFRIFLRRIFTFCATSLHRRARSRAASPAGLNTSVPIRSQNSSGDRAMSYQFDSLAPTSQPLVGLPDGAAFRSRIRRLMEN